MVDCAEVTLAGQPAIISGLRALFLPASRTLLIADLHLGKSHIFRRAGISVPEGSSADDIARLSKAIAFFEAGSVVVLGDILHGAALDPATLAAWNAMRTAHGAVDFIIIAGNHDRMLKRIKLAADVQWQPRMLGNLLLSHEPVQPRAFNAAMTVCGHLHPVVRIPLERRRYPAFHINETHCILPAFSLLTGGYLVDTRQPGNLWATHDGQLTRIV